MSFWQVVVIVIALFILFVESDGCEEPKSCGEAVLRCTWSEGLLCGAVDKLCATKEPGQ